MRSWLVLLASILVGSAVVAADDYVKIDVTPRFSREPTNIQVKLTVEPNYLNTGVCVILDSAEFGRRSCWELNGQHAPKVSWLNWPGVPAGRYTAYATLFQANKYVNSRPVEIQVLASGDEG